MGGNEWHSEEKDMDEAKKTDPWEAMGVPKDEIRYPRLLVERCIEWAIPPAALKLQPAFDRVLVKHIMPMGIEARDGKWFFRDSIIQIPETEEDRLQNMAPRVLIVAMGLSAAEQLNSHGIDVGHYATILRLSPYRIPIDYNFGKPITLTACRAQDLIGSEDTCRLYDEGKIERRYDKESNGYGLTVKAKGDRDANFIQDGLPSVSNPSEDM